jgi:hypothetical protein
LKADGEVLRFFVTAVQTAVNEGRHATVAGDLKKTAELWDSLDLLLKHVRIRLGLAAIPSPGGPVLPERLTVQVRLEESAPESSGQPEPDNALPPMPLTFRLGQVWRRPDGTNDFLVCDDRRHGAMEVQWCVEGRFDQRSWMDSSELGSYVAKNKLRPVFP